MNNTNFLEIIKALSMEIEDRLYSMNEDMEFLPQIAFEKLSCLPPFSSEEIVRCLLSDNDCIGEQFAPKHVFGDVRFTLYRSSKFIVELNVWQHTTTTIHEHSFQGAFKILSGSAIHSTYSFDVLENLNSYIQLGELKKDRYEILKENSVEKIGIGDSFIHNLVHTDNPTMTLIVRSIRGEEKSSYQRDFIGKNIAIFGDYYTDKSNNAVSIIQLVRNKDTDVLEENDSILNLLSKLNKPDLIYTLINTWQFGRYEELPGFNELVEQKLGSRYYASAVIDSIKNHRLRDSNMQVLRGRTTQSSTRKNLAILTESDGPDEVAFLYSKMFSKQLNKQTFMADIMEKCSSELGMFDEDASQGIISLIPELLDENIDDQDILSIRSMLKNSIVRPLVMEL